MQLRDRDEGSEESGVRSQESGVRSQEPEVTRVPSVLSYQPAGSSE
jgi:hypothetical protein